ncbi:MAG: response regulator transcription factor, partial [Mesorhizobium sp.]
VFLLDLYAAAVREEVGCFERSFFISLEDLVPFDAGWTGVAAQEDNRPVNHNSFTYHLPETFFRAWLGVVDHDPLADLSRMVFGQAAVVDIEDSRTDPTFRAWARSFGLRHLLRVCALDNRFGMIGFLSIYRRAANAPFTAAEVETMETLVPHLAAAMRINRTMRLLLRGKEGANTVRRAICDTYGTVHRSDKEFADGVKVEWPDWNGPFLPDTLCRHLEARPDQPFWGDRLCVRISPVAGLFVLELHPRSPLDRLGARELETIRHFANGASYKEVARRMNLAPATVRHHLRSAYRKLGVHDKAQMSLLIATMAGTSDFSEG